jgi:photoactive yellow protein
MKFDDPEILGQLEGASANEIEAQNFGVVRMKADATVTLYNVFESCLSGLDKKNVLGRNYFEEVAPCTNNYMVAQRFLDTPEMDAIIPYVFSFRMKPTAVRLRLLRSASAKSMYLLVERSTA